MSPRSAERVLLPETTGRPRSVERVTSLALGIAEFTPYSSPLPNKMSKALGLPRSVERMTSQALGIAVFTPHSSPLPPKTTWAPLLR